MFYLRTPFLFGASNRSVDCSVLWLFTSFISDGWKRELEKEKVKSGTEEDPVRRRNNSVGGAKARRTIQPSASTHCSTGALAAGPSRS